jgi:hypothetical protein
LRLHPVLECPFKSPWQSGNINAPKRPLLPGCLEELIGRERLLLTLEPWWLLRLPLSQLVPHRAHPGVLRRPIIHTSAPPWWLGIYLLFFTQTEML